MENKTKSTYTVNLYGSGHDAVRIVAAIGKMLNMASDSFETKNRDTVLLFQTTEEKAKKIDAVLADKFQPYVAAPNSSGAYFPGVFVKDKNGMTLRQPDPHHKEMDKSGPTPQ